MSLGTFDDNFVPYNPPIIPPNTNNIATGKLISPFKEYLAAVTEPKVLTESKEVPMASIILRPGMALISAGTIKNPPSIPKVTCG